MSGRLGDLSAAQETALSGLKDRIKDVITDRCDDQYLLRFLRSRQFDLEKTEKKIRATLEFRKKYGADTILKDWTPPPLVAQYFPSGHLPRPDKTDHLIVVLCLGSLDMKGLMKCHPREDLIKSKVYTMERTESLVKKIAKESGKNHDNITAIVDMEGLSAHQLWRPGLQLFSEFMQIEEMHYPEVAHRVLIIKPPRIFPTIYALVKPFVDPNTREKIEIISGNNYKERLLEITGPDNLPERYGGTLKECPTICWGGRIPKDSYKENDESLQHQYVKPGKSFVIEVEAQEGQEISWLFITENHDIAFGLYHVVSGENQELIPSERHAAHLGSVESSIICEKSGTYILEWDNSFSWTRGKNLRYRYEVAAPKDV